MLCQRFFFPWLAALSPSLLITPQSLKTLFSMVKHFEAHQKASNMWEKKCPQQTALWQASQAPSGQYWDPQGWLPSQPVLPAAIPCCHTMPLTQLQCGCADQRGWSYLPKGDSSKCLLCGASRRGGRELYSPCITAHLWVLVCVCFSLPGCSFTNACSQSQSHFKKCQSLLWLQVPVHLPQLCDASIVHFSEKFSLTQNIFQFWCAEWINRLSVLEQSQALVGSWELEAKSRDFLSYLHICK